MPLTSKLPSLYEVKLTGARTAVKKAEDEKKQQLSAATSTIRNPATASPAARVLEVTRNTIAEPSLPAPARSATTNSATAAGSTSGKPVYTGRNSRLLIGMPGTFTPPTLPAAGGQPLTLVLLPRASPSAETRSVPAKSLTLPTYADAARRNSLQPLQPLQPLANSTRNSGAPSPTLASPTLASPTLAMPTRSITVQGANRADPTTAAAGVKPLSPLLQPTASPSAETQSASAQSTALPTYTSSSQLSKIEPLARPLTEEEFWADTPEGNAARQAVYDKLQGPLRDYANKYGNRSGGFSSIYEWAPKLWEFIPWDSAFNKTELSEADIADALGVDRQALADYNEGAGKSGQLAIVRNPKQIDKAPDSGSNDNVLGPGIIGEILDGLQLALDIVGCVPGYGEAADVINALISLFRGNYLDAGLSTLSVIPIAGWASTIGKNAMHIADALGIAGRYGDDAISAAKIAGKYGDGLLEAVDDVLKYEDELLDGAGDAGSNASEVIDASESMGNYVDEAAVAEQRVLESAGEISIKSLDDFLSNPKAVADATSDQWYQYFEENGFNPEPLSGGTHKGVSYSDGGGYIIRWGGDRAFEYHPGGLNHHGGVPYYRISSGQTGKQWFDLNGNPIPRK